MSKHVVDALGPHEPPDYIKTWSIRTFRGYVQDRVKLRARNDRICDGRCELVAILMLRTDAQYENKRILTASNDETTLLMRNKCLDVENMFGMQIVEDVSYVVA